MDSPQDIIISCLEEKLIIANKSGKVWSSRAQKNLGSLSSRGYLVCTLHYKGMRKQAKIHQIIWIAFNGPISSKKIIDHKNRVKTDNRLLNLRLVSHKDNSKNRRSYKGENNPASKLIKQEADEIRRLSDRGFSYTNLSNMFSVSKSLIAKIVRNEIWS